MTDSDAQRPDDLGPTRFLDIEHPRVVELARDAIGDATSDVLKAQRLFLRVRDGWRYDPYTLSASPDSCVASRIAATDRAYCIPKAVLLAALARAVGIPSRLGFADVRNHLASPRLLERLGTDVFAWHGYVELFVDGRRVKATPAFNRELCERFDVAPLEFDGVHDAMLQPFDRAGHESMEYLRDHGTFDDLPFATILAAFRRLYGGGEILRPEHDPAFPRRGDE
ncbi:MAG: transglutaminase family protein [Nannocystaceae bacterium]